MANQVLAQSATQLAVSNAGSGVAEEWTDDMFKASVHRAASRDAKGLTRERCEIKRNKLITAVCKDYRAHFTALYTSSQRLPSDKFEQVEQAVDSYILAVLAQVNTGNCVSMRRSFSHKPAQMKFVEKVQTTGENELTLKEQHLGCELAIGACNRRLKDLEKGNRLTDDLRKDIRQQLMRLELTKQFIAGEIRHQEAAIAEPVESK